MKSFIIIPIIILAAIFSGYYAWWHYIAGRMENIISTKISELRIKGYQAYHGKMQISGFPFQISLNIPSPLLVTSNGEINYKGDGLSLSTSPLNIINYDLDIIGNQSININLGGIYDKFNITTNQPSIKIKFAFNGDLRKISLSFDSIDIIGRNSFNRSSSNNLAIDINLVEMPYLSDFGKDVIGQAIVLDFSADEIKLLKTAINSIAMDINHLSTKLNIIAKKPFKYQNYNVSDFLSELQKYDGEIDIIDLAIKWGDLHATGYGNMALDEKLYLVAKFNAKISGLEKTIKKLSNDGMINPKIAKLSTFGLKLISKNTDSSNISNASLQITSNNGNVYLGPLKIMQINPVDQWLNGSMVSSSENIINIAPIGKVEIKTKINDIQLPNKPPTVSHQGLINLE